MSSTNTADPAALPTGEPQGDPAVLAAMNASKPRKVPKHRVTWRKAFRKDWQLYALALLPSPSS
ncbi:hypothetical protein [Propioniciclava coleopterorum]|uniref:hypothetical protein n=1 Tax=Propioniciclava coleopterorum TaxID=2714937 RepID=UPI00197E80DA|nr:hypothetical protein [Propioniciclava coleopterorum]